MSGPHPAPPAASAPGHAPDAISPAAAPARLRVLLLTDEMEVGGTQRQIVHIARHLDRRRFEPTVLYFVNRSHFVDELEQSGVPVIHVQKRGRWDPSFLWNLVRTLRAGRYDVMHCFALSGEFWGTLAHALLPADRRPALLTSVRGTYEWYSPGAWRAKRWISRRSHAVIANSRVAASYACERIGWPDGAIRIAYNGVADMPEAAPPERRARLRAELGIDAGELMLLFVGRLVVHKDLPCLLRAMSRLHADGPWFRLVLAGDGPLGGELAAQIAALGLESRVKLLGQRDDIQDLIEASDIVVLPSLREGLSNVILEGMMGGRPVVASRAGGNVELVEDRRTGLLFDVGDDAGLACALRRLGDDAGLRRQLGEGARDRARAMFSIPAMIATFERLYAEAAGSRS